jgi:hypothetical protein
MNLKAALVFLAVLAARHAKDCWAWGTTGHQWVSGIAITPTGYSLVNVRKGGRVKRGRGRSRKGP